MSERQQGKYYFSGVEFANVVDGLAYRVGKGCSFIAKSEDCF